MSTLSSKRIHALSERAKMLAQARAFFMDRGVMEVDCPIITQGASVDAYIDLIPATYIHKDTRYLHSSPEYGMKRLISEGIGDIYQLSHVFRDGECGYKHNPEFTMAEWYRIGWIFEDLIEETVQFIQLFLGDLPTETISYRQAFQKFTDFDYLNMSLESLLAYCQQENISVYDDILKEGKDGVLNLILNAKIEPRLGENKLTVLAYYPSTQAALACTRLLNGESVAERFEVYYQGVELCNGYHELTDPIEQRKRFEEANKTRILLGKKTLPLDESFLTALQKGLPDCCGVAVGFDRLMMLRNRTSHIADVIPFDWTTA